MLFEAYLKKGLLKTQRVNFKQIEKQIIRAEKDIRTATKFLNDDPEWGATIAYHAMLRVGRALLFSKGFLPMADSTRLLLNLPMNCSARIIPCL